MEVNMRWRDGRRSSNIEDRRGDAPSDMGMAGGGGLLLRLLPFLLKRGGLKPLMLVGGLAVGAHMLGLINLPSILSQLAGIPSGSSSASSTGSSYQASSPEEQELAEFTKVVLADTEDTWQAIFSAQGQSYRLPTLVLYLGGTETACGSGQAAMGPFYCPGDEKLYIDLSFFDELRQRFGAPGDFAQAYVIAHEVGHHVQTLLGTSAAVQKQGESLSEAGRNQLSVRQELQADCYAGIWGFHANRDRQIIEEGDMQEALVAATAIGDDTLQRQAQGSAVPESFTHGSAEQRKRWLSVGFEKGDLQACNTFVANPL
jgi:uncharacterized protein